MCQVMNKFLQFPLLAVAVLGTAPIAHAQTVATDPVGAVRLTIKGNSDTIVAVPLTVMPNYSGAVASTAAGSGSAFNLNVSGTSGWTTNQFANLYYVRMTSGAKNGMYYTITANTAGQVTVDAAGDDLSGIAANDTFKILKYWTLGTLFPPASAGTATNPLTASTGLAAFQRKSQILVPNNVSAGINLSPAATYFFTTADGWVAADTGNPSATDTILWPDTYFIVRQPASITSDVSWTTVGSVVMSKLSTPLSTQPAAAQDNYLGLPRPVDIRVADAGLESGFTDSLGLAAFQRRDVLFIFDNTTAGFNKAPTKTLFRYNGTWYQATAGNPVANDELLLAGSGFVVRKYQSPSSTMWANNAPY
jgi:uncharacterized protein (TIGR02597 family)